MLLYKYVAYNRKIEWGQKEYGINTDDIIIDSIKKYGEIRHYCTLETDESTEPEDWRLLNDVKHLYEKFVNLTDGEKITGHVKVRQIGWK